MLAHWTDLARATALPTDDPDWRRLSACVGDVVTLQAVTLALGELASCDPATQALGADRAAVLIERATAGVARAWRNQPYPPQLRGLLDDARTALEQAQARLPARPAPTADDAKLDA